MSINYRPRFRRPTGVELMAEEQHCFIKTNGNFFKKLSQTTGLNQVFVSIQAKPTDVFIETVFIFAFHYFHNYQLFFFLINANIILNKIN